MQTKPFLIDSEVRKESGALGCEIEFGRFDVLNFG